MKKFYYISYVSKNRSGDYFGGMCITVHPIEWMIMARQMGNNDTVLTWHAITEEEYNIYARKL